MEEVLKGLQGQTFTKKKLFDFLADINIEELIGKKSNIIVEPEGKDEITDESKDESKDKINNKKDEFKCYGCTKSFATKSSLKRHIERYQLCKDWNENQKETQIDLSTGIHLIINDLLEKSIGISGQHECKFCKAKFITKGNHHKHLNTSTICNRLAFLEFKKLINSL
jgi:hypothetical protein